MKAYYLVGILSIFIMFSGCAGMESSSDKVVTDFLKEPLGTGSLEVGMTENQVINIYGEPTAKRYVKSADWKEPRQEWFYKAEYTVIPVGAGYLTEDLYLYFDGDNLTNISRRPLGRSVSDE